MKSARTFAFASGGIFLFYALTMGVIPGFVLSATPPTPGLVDLTAQAKHGRDLYVGNGCSYCHTQQVRPLAQDKVWGRPSLGGDYAYATPELLGTERTGPDLTNVGARESDVWEQIHLYNPRSLVAASIMPSYRWMFDEKDKADRGDVVVPVPPAYAPAGKVVIASSDVLAITAYLHSLKQTPLRAKAP
jgi:cytochrome c oxidase cbb3-type subunit 2